MSQLVCQHAPASGSVELMQMSHGGPLVQGGACPVHGRLNGGGGEGEEEGDAGGGDKLAVPSSWEKDGITLLFPKVTTWRRSDAAVGER